MTRAVAKSNDGFVENLSTAMDHQQHQLAGHESASVQKMRAAAFAKARDLGLPSVRHEDWKYTDLGALKGQQYAPAIGAGSVAKTLIENPEFDFAPTRLVFVDGLYANELSRTEDLPTGVSVQHISALLKADQSDIESQLTDPKRETNVFALVNTSFLQDGIIIEVANGVTAEPIHVLFVDSGQESHLHCPRLIINAGINSRSEIIETHISATQSSGLTNAVTNINGAAGANVDHYRLQLDEGEHHLANIFLEAEQDANVSTHSFVLGGGLTRIDINGDLIGRGAHIDMNGLFIARKNQHMDHHTRINHLSPATTSGENFKGIADDNGRGVFNGKIYVEQDAQQIAAQQSSKNLLLSEDAEIDTKPELEIYADDVQCAHGATVGQLSEDEFFYLRSRGIDEQTARSMLTLAFVSDVVNGVKNSALKRTLESKMSTLFGQA